jgi:patatin-like phospholipase/acyl hydrolase
LADQGQPEKLFRVLSLDGGGAKGFYTLGVLKEIEGLVGGRLNERFDLVYGTSTGAIIAALVCLGYSVDEILQLYREHVLRVMAGWLPGAKTAALQELSKRFSARPGSGT